MEIFQARLLVEMFVGGLAERETPEPFGPRKRDQEGSAAIEVKMSEARSAARRNVITGDTLREITDL